MNYTEEQIKDIKEREAKALEMLKELQLVPSVRMHAVNIKDDSFGIKPIAFLNDTKYSGVLSPITLGDL